MMILTAKIVIGIRAQAISFISVFFLSAKQSLLTSSSLKRLLVATNSFYAS
jgi:hypothetical protein